ncbi:MAG: PAS domain S-box protein [Propionivibrio sp.]
MADPPETPESARSNGDSDDLERQAEEIARAQDAGYPENVEELSPEAAHRLFHKLRVHQIALEIQNDALRQAQEEVDAARTRYFELYDQAPVGYCTLNNAGQIEQANVTAANLLGVSRSSLVGESIARFVHPDDMNEFEVHRQLLMETGETQACDLRLVKEDGNVFWGRLTSAAAHDINEKPVCRVVLNDITQRKQMEQLTNASLQYSRSLIEASLDPLVTISADGKITDVNRATELVTGIDRDRLINSDFADYFTDPEEARAGYQLVFSKGYVTDYPLAIRHVSGKITDVLYNASVYVDPNGKVNGVFAAARDITERKRVIEELREQKEFFHLIAENIGDFIAVLDLDGHRIYNSPSYMQLFGSKRDLRGTDSFAEIHPDDRERVRNAFRETVKTGRGRQLEYRMVLGDGSTRIMESRGSVIRDQEGKISRVVVVSHDITERKHMENQVRQMAFHDALTQLPNRRLLNDRLNQTMAASARSGYHGALMFLDLDNFKPLNDKHGHDVGDLLLIEVAGRLKGCVREMDTVARFGGDEFVVMISELSLGKAQSLAEAGIIAEKIRRRLAEPYRLAVKRRGRAEETVEHQCTATIGVVVFVDHEAAPAKILKWADAAMYRAKESGRNRVCVADLKHDDMN